MNTKWRDIDFADTAGDVSPGNNCEDAWEWRIEDTDRRVFPLTT